MKRPMLTLTSTTPPTSSSSSRNYKGRRGIILASGHRLTSTYSELGVFAFVIWVFIYLFLFVLWYFG
ncbi:hypothetical protein Q3G72_002304 [Acer saccharum]|nr:hypothetical protein Q3G72_002304 [Acer saccharum]